MNIRVVGSVGSYYDAKETTAAKTVYPDILPGFLLPHFTFGKMLQSQSAQELARASSTTAD